MLGESDNPLLVIRKGKGESDNPLLVICCWLSGRTKAKGETEIKKTEKGKVEG